MAEVLGLMSMLLVGLLVWLLLAITTLGGLWLRWGFDVVALLFRFVCLRLWYWCWYVCFGFYWRLVDFVILLGVSLTVNCVRDMVLGIIFGVRWSVSYFGLRILGLICGVYLMFIWLDLVVCVF